MKLVSSAAIISEGIPVVNFRRADKRTAVFADLCCSVQDPCLTLPHMDARFSPEMTVERFARRRGIPIENIGVAPTVIVSWGLEVIRSMADAIGAQPSPNWLYGERQPFFTGQHGAEQVCLVVAPVGASGTVVLMEEMIACGAKVFFGLGWAGSLQPSAPIGTFVVPTTCVREEGTSFHYVDGSAPIGPDANLARLLEQAAASEGIKIATGPCWSTDAPYRELVSKIEDYRGRGVLCVDMETSAMYALGQFRRVSVCNLLVISDEIWSDWQMAFGSQSLAESTKRAQDVLLRCVKTHRPHA